MAETCTTCPYCGVGCGVIVENGAVKGDRSHPANAGRLCSKGSALGETLDDSTRLLHPRVQGERADWGSALDLVAARFKATIAAHGPDSVAFYVSGQMLTEDYYVANKLMKGFIGSGNIDTNSRLCMASTVAGHNRAFGADVVPGIYEDWDEADLVVLVGSNTAWCHPILFQRLERTRVRRGTYVIAIDPRRTATAEAADLHLPIAAGADVALFAGLLVHLAREGLVDEAYVAAHTEGFSAALDAAHADAPDLAAIARITGLPAAQIEEFYRRFAATERVVTVFSQGVNQSSAGADKVNAIINCHLAVGRIGKPGMGPFSVTGQPNAMGGREVGGLANQLAAHRKFDDPADVARVGLFWNAPRIARAPGLKAVEMFEAVADGRIKAIWIIATNPAVSMPRADLVRAALRDCPLVVVSDCWETDTSLLADVVLPAAGWGEKDGTVTNSERMMSRQRRFRAPVAEARPDWWMICEVARRMGWHDAFDFAGPAAIFREHAALSNFDPDPSRFFTLGALAGISDADYDRMSPLRWPVGDQGEGAGRLFGDGRFATADGRARFVALKYRPPKAKTGRAQPFLLNTGRLRDQWHTMTRTGLVPRLMAHQEEPLLDLHPADARKLGVAAGDLVRASSAHGALVTRVRISDVQARGTVFTSMHWTDQFSSTGPIDRLVEGACDPVSGQPELKATSVTLAPVPSLWRGVQVGGRGPVGDKFYHARITGEQGTSWELAGWDCLPAPIAIWARELLGEGEMRALVREDLGIYRYALVVGGKMRAGLALASNSAHVIPSRDALLALLDQDFSEYPLFDLQKNEGQVVRQRAICTCFGVSRAAIEQAASLGANSVEAVGERLKAGTNCGSCRPEIKEILRHVLVPA